MARSFEIKGDSIGAIIAYREVIRCGDESNKQEARRRVQELARRAWPERPL